MNKLKICAWSGIIFLAYFIANFYIVNYYLGQDKFILKDFLNLGFFVIGFLMLLVFSFGVISLGKKTGSRLYYIGSLYFFITVAFMFAYNIIFYVFIEPFYVSLFLDSICIMIIVACLILMGIGFIKDSKKVKTYANMSRIMKASGIMSLISGVSLISLLAFNYIMNKSGAETYTTSSMLFLGLVAILMADYILKIIVMFMAARADAKHAPAKKQKKIKK